MAKQSNSRNVLPEPVIKESLGSFKFSAVKGLDTEQTYLFKIQSTRLETDRQNKEVIQYIFFNLLHKVHAPSIFPFHKESSSRNMK